MDGDLEAIRQKRMMELAGGQGGMPASEDEAAAQEEARRAQEEQRQTMLAAIMTGGARERLSRIALVKPDKARAVENMILAAAQRGQLGEKVSEERLVSMLETINEKQGTTKPKITIQRRRPAFDDDDY
eukprot:CAMPEP_0202866346 /NCGR_PEP_ID=MMETSP1391-20130828/7333_1 /ASSEMBLY_ACC=CAM_ASM_000867 /TAXON_ID=1034604 /ORGANISM="Chlamydomonas leiostraca, Strain SAG 11-49" /LENGTH=128 /DNA_ID=CAMNT_0049546281 /DNA_START=66 /DNA_END=452 /DNA_ORIENTATION=-